MLESIGRINTLSPVNPGLQTNRYPGQLREEALLVGRECSFESVALACGGARLLDNRGAAIVGVFSPIGDPW